jgi:hypothetical protein
VADQALAAQDTSSVSASQIVSSAPTVQRLGTPVTGLTIFHPIEHYAPAWFYSALNWLGSSFQDASGAQRTFADFMIGSDVDPYHSLGATRLFFIARVPGAGYELSVAADTSSTAPLTGATAYDASDAGILAMYQALAASPVFAPVTYCAVPTLVTEQVFAGVALPVIQPGYDPSTGIRVIVEGTAAVQVVPLGDFQAGHNEQVYDDDPEIVPVVSALVYDISQYNTIDATTFVLPAYYSRDQIGSDYYVSRQATTITVNEATVSCGQTVVFPVGPGFELKGATPLKLESTSVVAEGGRTVRTYTFDQAKVISEIELQPEVQTGICTLTYTGSPGVIFAQQSIVGFYQLPAWGAFLGVPIYDYGKSNGAFTATSAELADPTLIYGKTNEFLNGGSLRNVLQRLLQATYMLSSDRLAEILDDAIQVGESATGAGLSVTTAALDFTMSSAAGSTVVNSLSVPVVATVTTTPPPIKLPGKVSGDQPAESTVVQPTTAATVTAEVATLKVLQPVGGGANNPITIQAPPQTVQVALTATIPQVALAATGIGSIEIGTAFPVQSLGNGSTFGAEPAGTVINLTATATPALAPLTLTLATTGIDYTAGKTYMFSAVGSTLTVTDSDGSLVIVLLPEGENTDTTHTFVGMAVYTMTAPTVPLYPLVSLSFPAPAAGADGVVQGASYSLRLTYGSPASQYDIIDSTGSVVASAISVTPGAPADGSAPQAGAYYFGTFTGGAATATVWSVPVFLPVTPAEVSGAGFGGAMTLGSQVSGLPAYDLTITDSSLFVYSNIDIDDATVGSVSASNVYLASAVINSAPDNHSAQAFAPSRLLMGIIRQVQMGNLLEYVFIPEDDSVVIGGVRYILSVINLGDLTEDPNALPYPPSNWPTCRFWQFANRHNPYLAVQYQGETEQARMTEAAGDVAQIASATRAAQEPMQLYLDTNPAEMTVWPIYKFPYATSTQAVDQGQLKLLTSTILGLLATDFPQVPPPTAAELGEQILLPAALQQDNPYTYQVSPAATAPGSSPIVLDVASAPVTTGQVVTNLAPNQVNIAAQASAGAGALPLRDVVQGRETNAAGITLTAAYRQPQVIYGFSVFNSSTGEAYIVEIVGTDLAIPDQLPLATENTTYDPFYVRVVFLNRLTAYNMSVIVPSMARDQYNYLAQPMTAYQNVISKTDDFELGYTYQLADAGGAYDELEFIPSPIAAQAGDTANIYTNLPYILRGGPRTEASFACRRVNWDADCLLMHATQLEGKAIYMAFGGGDLVPMRLDAGVTVDSRQPAHMVEFSHAVTDQLYDSVQAFSTGNVPYFIGVTTNGSVQYTDFSLGASAQTAGFTVSPSQVLQFPPDIYVVGEASTTFTTVSTDTGAFVNQDSNLDLIDQQFQVIPYNNLVYLVRAVSNAAGLARVGGSGAVSGLLIDTYVPTPDGHLARAQAARYKQSGLQYFGSTYTPTTMVDTLDQLDYTSITGETFYAPTVFVPIPELDSTKGFVANLSDFIGQQVWTFVYPEIVASPGDTVNGVQYAAGYNLDPDGKPILSLQKLHFVYDPLAVMFTPNDLTHKYPLQPKQQVLALTNGQLREGICWRTADVQPDRDPPQNVCAQEILPAGIGMDRPNIVYSSHNRPVWTAASQEYQGMSLQSIISVSGTVYNIEESALQSDQTGTGYISQVATASNLLIAVLFDYDNDDLGTLSPYDETKSTKGVVFVNGYQSPAGFTFSSPDHFDVNDILPCQVPLLDEIAEILGNDVAYYNLDASLPQQFWSFSYDDFTAPGLPNYIADVPPAPVDPTFANRTRSLVLNMQNQVRPTQLGLMDTYSSVVAASLHLENGITGAIFVSKKADRDIASIGSNPPPPAPPSPGPAFPLFGLTAKYDFYIFSRDHYATLHGCSFELIDEGYAMCLVDDGTGTGTKIAQYYVDSDGNYNELYTYVLYSPAGGVLETNSFALKVTLGSPANLAATPPAAETPNSANPMDLATQINKLSNLVFAAFGPSSPGQPPAYLPIQAIGLPASEVQAAPISGAPGPNGYNLNVAAANRQPVQISQIFSASTAYQIAGSTTTIPLKSGKAVPFYGSLSHGLDKQVPVKLLQSADGTSFLPRTTVPPGPAQGLYGGCGLGALIGTQYSWAFQGSGAIPPAIASDPAPGTTMKADDSVFYTFNAITNGIVDSTGKSATAAGSQYFVDQTDPGNPIYAVVALPKFTLAGVTYSVNVNTSLADGVTSRYTLVFGGQSYLFDSANQVTANRTRFTFNPLTGGVYTVTYASLDAPEVSEAPTPITLTPFSMTAGGLTTVVDVFNNPGGLQDVVLGVTGRQYTYDPVTAVVTVTAGATSTTAQLQTGITFVSNSFYGYVIGFAETGSGTGAYTVNGSPMFPYSASTTGAPASYPIMTAPEMFTVGGNFYTFDQDASGDYLSVTGNGTTIPINPYQFSLNGAVYVINTNVQPNTVVGNGNTYTMTTGNTQFVIDRVPYTITLKAGSLSGATVSGQYDITQANVVVLENYVYELDILDGQIVGNGLAYPLTSSGFTYSIATANQSFTVTTEANATTVTIGGVVYQINNTTVVGDGVTYPILTYRTFADGTATYQIGTNGTADLPAALPLSTATPQTFTDGAATYTVNQPAAFDGTDYYLISGTPAGFTAAGVTWQLRTDGVSIAAGPAKTYIVTTGAAQPNSFQFGPTTTIYFGRPTDVAAFDGVNYYQITHNSFTDSDGNTYTLSGNTAVHDGNSYEIYSNLGQGDYFEVAGGSTYFVNVAVADTGTPTGSIYQVFPVTGSAFAMPLRYTISVAGDDVTVAALTFPGGSVTIATLTASAGKLTGGHFTDPVTGVTYTCVVDGPTVTFVDSNNTVYPYPAAGTTDVLVASVTVTTAVSLAVDAADPSTVYPVVNNEFVAVDGTTTTTYTADVPVASDSAAGPYWPIVNGRFVVPQNAPLSDTAYTIRGGGVIKGYVISADDQFSPDGKTVYTVNAVNVVKATDQATLSGSTLTNGTLKYILGSPANFASTEPPGLSFSTAGQSLTVSYNGTTVTYTLSGATVKDNRHPANTFTATRSGSSVTFTDTVSGVTWTFNDTTAGPVTAELVYVNDFFTDPLAGVTYYVDTTSNRVEAISYLAETTEYAFTAANGITYLIHYNDVEVYFPVVSGTGVNAGVATVGTDVFTVQIDEVEPTTSGTAIPVNRNSFEINGNLYTITGTPNGSDYSACSVVGEGITPQAFLSASTFRLTDPAVVYTVQLDSDDLPTGITATFAVKPSQDLISINDDVYLITYTSTTTGSLLGQGQSALPITASAFKLTNPFDTTTGKFIFDDADIYDAGSVVGQYTVYLAPTFFLNNLTFTLNTTTLLVTDSNKVPYPLIPNPTMLSINGENYVLDTNLVPHAVVGNNTVSPLSTDVTVQQGMPVANTTFTLGGQIYAYAEDSRGNLLAITGTKLYPVAQPALTFKLDSSLIFTITTTPPAAEDWAGTVAPIGTVTAGSAGAVTTASTILNLYAGPDESGGHDYFMYKNVLYTLIKSAGTYTAVQKTYTVYASVPASSQQQLAVFDLAGTTYLVTDGTTAGTAPAAGINPGTMWSQTAIAPLETQFGLVYGLAATPTPVSRETTADGTYFQFSAANSAGVPTLYNILYTAGADTNQVQVNVPDQLPTFTQAALFNFYVGKPLTVETGGYNAFTAAVAETAQPAYSYAGAFRTPLEATDSSIDDLISTQGDFSLEFWHSLTLTPQLHYHPFTYQASTQQGHLVYDVDVDFDSGSQILVRINNVVMQAVTTPPVFSSRWRHFALTYQQPYTMVCQGDGYEVADGTNFDVSGDFSLAMTFAASDVQTVQSLVYKGTGSNNTAPSLAMSYELSIGNGTVNLTLTDGDGNNPTFTGPPIQENNYYQVIAVKHATTAATDTSSDNTDPYIPPFDTSTSANPLQNTKGSVNVGPVPMDGGTLSADTPSIGSGDSTSRTANFLTSLQQQPPAKQSYTVTISVRPVYDNGTLGDWVPVTAQQNVPDSSGLTILATGAAHVLIGGGFDSGGNATPLGVSTAGNIRDLYIFNSAIDRAGLRTNGNLVDLAAATSTQLSQAGILGYWPVEYDPNGVISNPYDQTAVAISTNAKNSFIAPLSGHELEGTTLYVNGYQMPLTLAAGAAIEQLPPYSAGSSLLLFNAGPYRLEEISVWNMCRAQYQVLDDMFGRLVPANEPYLSVYLSGEFALPETPPPVLPTKKLVDGVQFTNAVDAYPFSFTPASIDLIGSPCVGRCGPLITPNLYTPPGVALTVCDTVPELTSYSVTLNTTTATLAGEINEAYAYVKNGVLELYAGKKIGDLTLSWISQEQGDVQIIGYVEGAPPVPMANLTNKSSYAGATSVTLSAPTSLTLKYQTSQETSHQTQWVLGDGLAVNVGAGFTIAPFGFGIKDNNKGWELALEAAYEHTHTSVSSDSTNEQTASMKLDESYKYTVKTEGTMSPYTGDQFMANLNTVTTPSTTPGTPGSKSAILPNPNLGGFSTSNPPAALPKTAVTEEKFGQRMFVPSPYGQAFVVSQTLDVYQETLVQSGTVYGFVAVPNAQIPRDINVVSFRLNSQYLRPGCLDGMVGYAYNPAALPNGAKTYTTSTGELEPVYDGNFAPGVVGHDASYMQLVEAYRVKKQIDQEAFSTLALYNTASGGQQPLPNAALTPALDFYDEYIWSSRGAVQEVKHTYTTTYEEVQTASTSSSDKNKLTFNAKLTGMYVSLVNATGSYEWTDETKSKFIYTTTGTSSFDITASFDGIDTDTQMRYASNNDAHFVMNNNSMYNPSNQSGIDLVIGSDGLVYQIVPSPESGAGLPGSNNLDTTMTYTQPQPSYTSGNADGLTGNLEPYDRPGKTSLFRTYAYFLQPSAQNAADFWSTVVDPVWLLNSPDPDAAAMRDAQQNTSVPWRLFYRVTYSERFLPPVSTGSTAVPQITPIMAVPVLDSAAGFAFQALTAEGTRPAGNPANDIEANIVLVSPTQSGASAGTTGTSGPYTGLPVPPNNVIPWDFAKTPATIVDWADTNNAKLLTQLITSVTGSNLVAMSSSALPGSTLAAEVQDPASGSVVYEVYTDPNGMTVNVPANPGVVVYQDVNGNPVQYFDGKVYHSLQADYVASPDGTIMYYIQPPSSYDASRFNLAGDYDIFTMPGDEWRYYLVSGASSDMTGDVSFADTMPFMVSEGPGGYTGFTVATQGHDGTGTNQVKGYVLAQGVLQYPNLSTSAETFADVLIYKSMALLDTFPIGDPETLISFLEGQYPTAPFVAVENDEITLVFARNITSYFNTLQQGLTPQ